MFDCNLTLWEWYFNTIVVQRFIDTFHDNGNIICLGEYV